MLLDKVPDELHDERAEQWTNALRILDGVAHEPGFGKATLSAYSRMDLWELEVRRKDGDLVVDDPVSAASGSVMNSWFQTHLDVEITTIGLQRLVEWMEQWLGYDQIFFPALLIEGSTCRSHRAGASERFIFVWE